MFLTYFLSIFRPPVSGSQVVYEELKKEFPDHIPLLLARITALEAEKEMVIIR